MDIKQPRYKCLSCGRDKFTKPHQPHYCLGGYRKHGIKSIKIETMEELIKKVEGWAADRGIDKPGNSGNQLLKTLEELGEVSRGLLRNDKEAIMDGIGDVLVTLIIFSKQQGTDLETCLKIAYNEIKDRKGKTEDGIFIKDE